MQPCLIEAIFTSLGLTRILSFAPSFSFRGAAKGGAVAAVLLGWGAVHWEAMDQSGNYVVWEFGNEVLNHLPRDALFLSMTDLVTNSVRYIQVCHRHRQVINLLFALSSNNSTSPEPYALDPRPLCFIENVDSGLGFSVRKAWRSKDGSILCFAVPLSRVNRKTVSISRPRNNLAVMLESRMPKP